MPIGDVDVLFSADDASVLRALAAQERAVQQSAGKMEREWNTATEKAQRHILGFANVGKAGMYGVLAGVTLGAKAASDYAREVKSVGDEYGVLKKVGTDAWTSIGRSISGLVIGRSTQARTIGAEILKGLEKAQNVTADIFKTFASGGISSGESAADFDRAMVLLEKADRFTLSLAGIIDRRLEIKRQMGLAAVELGSGSSYDKELRKINIEYQARQDALRQQNRDGKLRPDEYRDQQILNQLNTAKAIKKLNDDRDSDQAKRREAQVAQFTADMEAEDRVRRDQFDASQRAREEAMFRKQSYEIDAMAADGHTRDAEIARVRLDYAKQYLDVERDTLLTIEERASLVESMQKAEEAQIRALTAGDQRVSSGRGVNAGIGSAGIANSVLASAGRRDVAAAVDRVGRIAADIKQILERSPGTATFGR